MTLVSGSWLAARLSQRGVPHTVAVPFGIDKSSFAQAQPDTELRRELLARAGAPPDAALLLSVSRLHPEKRLGTLLAAVRALASERPIALVVYGDGPLQRYYRAQARGLPVYFAGVTRDRALLARTMASCDLLLHGSAAETFGLVVAEALCAGLPVVVPNSGGARELAGPAHAELYEAGDPRACAAAVIRMLGRDREAMRLASRCASDSQVLTHTQHWQRLFATYAALQRPAGGPTHPRAQAQLSVGFEHAR